MTLRCCTIFQSSIYLVLDSISFEYCGFFTLLYCIKLCIVCASLDALCHSLYGCHLVCTATVSTPSRATGCPDAHQTLPRKPSSQTCVALVRRLRESLGLSWLHQRLTSDYPTDSCSIYKCINVLIFIIIIIVAYIIYFLFRISVQLCFTHAQCHKRIIKIWNSYV